MLSQYIVQLNKQHKLACKPKQVRGKLIPHGAPKPGISQPSICFQHEVEDSDSVIFIFKFKVYF